MNSIDAEQAEQQCDHPVAVTNWKVGDWAIYDRRIVQIKRIDDYCEVSDGTINTSGSLVDGLRPLTLRNKAAAEAFAYYYDELHKIDGHQGFNWPGISSYFTQLMLQAIDADPEDGSAFKLAQEFVHKASDRPRTIQSVALFRRAK